MDTAGQQDARPTPRVIATWSFSAVGVRAAAAALSRGASALDAVVAGVKAVELDPTVTSVGYGGLPSRSGALELDAAVMTGSGAVGAVAALPRCRAAAPVALAVLRSSPHAMLAGAGAADFAEDHALAAPAGSDDLLTAHARRRLAEFRAGEDAAQVAARKPVEDRLHTDTVGMVCVDAAGEVAACCATSGLEFKAAGRVGDAPLVGAGLYALAGVGAAVASGEGDKMVRFCLSFAVVEEMRRGASAQAACDAAVRRVREADPTCQAAICAVDSRDGTFGAACTRDGFKVVQWVADSPGDGAVTVAIPGVAPATPWKHTCV